MGALDAPGCGSVGDRGESPSRYRLVILPYAARRRSINAGNLAGQAFEAGLIDEVRIDLVPVVLGGGIRFFGDYDQSALLLDDPEIVPGDRVTHLHYRVRK
jgi:1-acyl-sn-glycerol-3-phosphate acyltransferase